MKHNIKLPKNALSKINLGQSFAEYDLIRTNSELFVKTPAILSALSLESTKCFFVGRRGTGKTAITYFLQSKISNSIQIIPQIFDLIELPLELKIFVDTRQRPFKSLVSCFQRSILDEVLSLWFERHLLRFSDRGSIFNRERNMIEDFDFDTRMLHLVEEIFDALANPNKKEWLKLINRPKDLYVGMNEVRKNTNWDYIILIDRIDESWSGSDECVVLLMALMHACLNLNAYSISVGLYLFLRENIFERVRQLDNEFARLETSVVPMDWTHIQLVEMIERRLNLPFHTRLPLGGSTWDYFFEKLDDRSSRDLIFDYCQNRPRDILTYCTFAVESAQTHNHEIIKFEDIQEARRRFSDSRLKDLGDEYQENFPQISLIISKFYGLGNEYTISGIESFIQKILLDKEVKNYCSRWIFKYTTPSLFIELFYNIGFFGLKYNGEFFFRSLGPKSSTPPPIGTKTRIIIHPSYSIALNLRSTVIMKLDEEFTLQQSGLLLDLPEGTTYTSYQDKLRNLQDGLKTLSVGLANAAKFEEIVGDIIKFCFFRSRTNVQSKERDNEGTVIRDWIAANRASGGFWEMVRQRYKATQIVWESKNYEELNADDFHQGAYYMTKEIGRFVVIAFRGNETKKSYYRHIKRIANDKEGGILLLLNERDLHVFIRQAINVKIKEDHINGIYYRTVREIS